MEKLISAPGLSSFESTVLPKPTIISIIDTNNIYFYTSASHCNTDLLHHILNVTAKNLLSPSQLLCVTPSCHFFSDKIKRILQHLGLQLPPSISSEFPPTTDYFSYFLLPPHQKPLIQYVWPLSRVAVAVPRINVWDLWTEGSIASATLETTTSLACDGGLKPEEGTDHLGKTGSER